MSNKLFCMAALAGAMAVGCNNSDAGDGGEDAENSGPLCSDGIDNDGDGAVDCDDAECASFCMDTDTETVFEPDTEDTWHNKSNRGDVVDPGVYVSDVSESGAFGLVTGGNAVPLLVSSDDFPGVKRVVTDLQADIERVTTVAPDIAEDSAPGSASEMVIIGTIGRSPLIDELVENETLDIEDIEGKWETFVITAVDNPMDGVDRALVIAGSDQRGTIYGVYDLSAQIGVSPWYFWDDVPAQQKEEIYVLEGRHSQGEPAVKYRGFFINDENPSLDQWHRNYFPDEGYAFKKAFYAKIFEVMLRIKANYLWPAVWGRAFAEDDEENHATAKAYGVVMGTSHEAPMMRGIEEWNRGVLKDADGNELSDAYGGNGEWRYSTNADALKAYWRDGMERMVEEDFEGVVTIGMRGPGDVALAPEDGIPLVDEFIGAQREIIAEATGEHPSFVPQVWTLYKEVQEWWEEGLRVPHDVTVIWADDNWGNMRKLQDPGEPERSGGYGLYYHYDYVGGPRCYKWVDTNLLPNIWEQLHLSYNRGVDRLWIVNVGDMKGNELPLQFFMDYAWNPERWPVERIPEWELFFAEQQFGVEHGEAIADVLNQYAALQSDRKPELMNRNGTRTGCPFSLTNYREMERVVDEWLALADEAEAIGASLPDDLQDTYYQLVLYQVKASALMYELRLAGFKNRLYADQGRASANDMAAIAEDRFEQSRAMADYYNDELAGGKWEGFQTQPYLGYNSWQQPETNGQADADSIYPELESLEVPEGADMGVAIDGSELYWPEATDAAILPAFSPYQVQPPQYIEIFNRGTEPFDYEITITPDVEWLTVTPNQGTIDDVSKEVRAEITVADWSSVPEQATSVSITVTNVTDDVSVEVEAIIENPTDIPSEGTFVESNGYISIEADNYSRVIDAEPFTWTRIPDIGRTGAGMTPFPVTAERVTPGGDSARLEYDIHLFTTGTIEVWTYLSPRQNVLPTDGLTYAVSIDDEDPVLVNITDILDPRPFPEGLPGWERGVSDNVHRVSTALEVEDAGPHVLKIWAVDPSVVLQKIVVDTGGLLDSYLGPPESIIAR